MNRKSLHNAIDGLLRSINLLHQNKLLLPAMMMTYSTIDILSSLTCTVPATESTGSDFKNWVNRYLLPGSQLCCSADDLWGARCGLIHTYTSNSSLSQKGKIRKIVYLSGVLDEPLRNTTDFVAGEYLVVVSQDLFNALSTALTRFMADLKTDVILENRVIERADKLFVSIPMNLEVEM